MSWTMYRWVWRLCSPLHIGATPAGSLNRTRLYIPARNMWAALTAEIARRQSTTSFPEYQQIGQTLRDHARFSYLFPAEKVNNRWCAWLPRYDEGGLCWYREDRGDESIPDRLFRQQLLNTRPSTAIAPGTGAAEDGTLREVEHIHSHWRNRPTDPVAFVGYLFLHQKLDSSITNTLQQIRELYIGGETRYGFGHLLLEPYDPQHPWEQASRCFGASVDLSKDNPIVQSPASILAHAFARENSVKQGALETLVQWDWDTFQHLQSPVWTPGSQSAEGAKFAILDSGLWQARRAPQKIKEKRHG